MFWVSPRATRACYGHHRQDLPAAPCDFFRTAPSCGTRRDDVIDNHVVSRDLDVGMGVDLDRYARPPRQAPKVLRTPRRHRYDAALERLDTASGAPAHGTAMQPDCSRAGRRAVG